MFHWDPSPFFLAQAGHFLFGMVSVFAPLAIWPTRVRPVLGGTGAIILYGVLKETLFDPVVETNEPFVWSGAIDLAFIVLGASIAWGLIRLANRVPRE